MTNKKDSKEFSWIDVVKFTWKFLHEQKYKFIFWVILISIVYAYNLIPPYLIGLMIDFLSQYEIGNSLNPLYIIIAILGFGHIIISLLRLTSKEKIGGISAEAVYNIKVEGFEKLMDFSIKWHDNENTGNKVQKIIKGADGIKRILRNLSNSSGIIDSIIVVFGVAFVFLLLDYIYLVFFITYILLFFAIEYFFNKLLYKVNVEANIANEKSAGVYFEGASNVLTVKSLGMQSSVHTKVEEKENISKTKEIKSIHLGISKWKVFQILNGISLIIFLLMVSQSVLTGALSAGMVLTYYAYFSKLRKATGDLTNMSTILIEAKADVARMAPIFEEEILQNKGDLTFPKNWNKLEIKNGSFSYQSDDKNFNINNLNIEINKNEKVGIVGHSGSGKSTLAKLLLGLYKLDSGEFKIGETNYYDIQHEEITHNLSIVLQESELFNLSLAENIKLMREVDPILFFKAIEISQLQPVIEKLPNGLETMIGEKGYRLSGGERQRLGIARAICKNPQILVLDEATSSLDSETEKRIQKALEKEMNDKTLIIIAHRLSTLDSVDKILVFDNGEVIENGEFNQLLNDPNSNFHRLYNLQSTSEASVGKQNQTQ